MEGRAQHRLDEQITSPNATFLKSSTRNVAPMRIVRFAFYVEAIINLGSVLLSFFTPATFLAQVGPVFVSGVSLEALRPCAPSPGPARIACAGRRGGCGSDYRSGSGDIPFNTPVAA
jgi:hypothetical protein